jgi:disulfide bond formation protein DsbB
MDKQEKINVLIMLSTLLVGIIIIYLLIHLYFDARLLMNPCDFCKPVSPIIGPAFNFSLNP